MVLSFLKKCFVAGVVSLVCLPLAAVAFQAWQTGSENQAFILQNALSQYLPNSLRLVFFVIAGSSVIGVSAAWAVTHFQFAGRRSLEWLLMTPLAFPAYIMAYAYTDFLDVAGPVQSALRDLTGLEARQLYFPEIRSLAGAACILSLCLYPYVYVLARAAFAKQARSQIDAARLLGASPLRIFFTIALPGAWPHIVLGVILVTMETLSDFGTVSYFGIQVFSTGIYNAWTGYGDVVSAAQLSLILVTPVLILIFMEKSFRYRIDFSSGDDDRSFPAETLSGIRSLLCSFFCAIPVFLGFFIPLVILLKLAFFDTDGMYSVSLTDTLISPLLNTVLFAGIAALCAIILAAAIFFAIRRIPSAPRSALQTAVTYGYGFPGIIIGLGFLIVTGWWKTLGGPLLTGSFIFLIFAYIVRFLAIPVNAIEAAYAKIGASISDAASLLDRNPVSRFLKIDLPFILPSLSGTALILFIEVMKELPITLILRPFDYDTLAIRVYNLASDERLAEAALPSLLIVAAGTVSVFLLTRFTHKKKDAETSAP